ncbi:MAG: NHL repeat-containing protein [Pseudomonadota bacterium]
MRKLCLSFSILFLLLGVSFNSSAETARIKHLVSVYVDNEGNKLKDPEGVACQGDSFLVADTGNSRIVRYSFKNATLAAEGQFPLEKAYPITIQVNSKGEIYYLDGVSRRITVLTASGEPKGVMKFDGVPEAESLMLRNFKIDSQDNINLLDIFSERVVIVNSGGKFVKSIPFPGGYGFFSDLAIDGRGKVFLLDSINATVYGQNEQGDGFSPLSKNMKEYMNFPTGIALDRSGQIFLTDQFGSGLVLIGRDGAFLGRKISMGWIDSLLFYPSQICINSTDEIFIADRSNSRVQVFGLVEK